jgi:D-aminopeptidase
LPPLRARELIEEGAERALADLSAVPPYDPGRPCEIRIELNTTDAADKYKRKPGVEVIDSRQVVCRADDWWTAWQRFFF